MPEKYAAVVLIGLPGTGKGTQGRVIGMLPGFHYFSSGDMFRALETETEVGRQVHELINRGDLVPDELVISLWHAHMTAEMAADRFRPREQILILDGLPRTVPQTEMLDDYVEVFGVLYLGADDEEKLIQRLARRSRIEGRKDDQEAVIRRRLEIFHRNTAPVMAHYPPESVVRLNALQSPLEVLRELIDVLIPITRTLAQRNAAP